MSLAKNMLIWVGGRIKKLGPLTNLSVFTMCFIIWLRIEGQGGYFFYL